MTESPRAVLVLDPRLSADILPDDLMDRLRRTVRLEPGAAIRSFDRVEGGAAGLADVEIAVTGWGCPVIDDATLLAMPRLRAVVHAAGTVKHHVPPAVFDRGVVVSSAAAVNAVPVAEYTIAVLVLAAKQAFAQARWYGEGQVRPEHVPGDRSGLYGATVGVIGASRIGRLVLDRIGGTGAHPLVADPYLTTAEADALGAELVGVDDLCRRSDLVTVHAPELPETRHLLDGRRLALLPDGAVVVNTARGSLVDTDALAKECATGRLSAVLDVTDPEPLPPEHPLHRLPTVLVTPHVAGARGRELRRLGEFAVAEVERVVRGEPLVGLVRADELARIA